MQFVAAFMKDRGWQRRRVGAETDSYYFSPKAYAQLCAGLGAEQLHDASQLVNWVRAVKSEGEVACMRRAARMVGGVMQVAYEAIAPGVRQCDVAARIYAAQVGGDAEVAGDVTGLCPFILTGESSAAPHLMWSERRFREGEATVFELGAAFRHYNAGLARTVHLGRPPARLQSTAHAVEEGMAAVLAAIRPGITAGAVEAAWRAVISRHGLRKESRIGYSIGLGYPPDWGEQTISLRADESSVLEERNTLHVILGMWMDGWGLEISETVLVTARGSECLTQFPRQIHVK
jgi:Xaa-Pro dipeptidase